MNPVIFGVVLYIAAFAAATPTSNVSCTSPRCSQTSSSLKASASWSSLTDSTPTQNGSAALNNCLARLDGKLPDQLPTGFDYSGRVRTYYVQAEMEEWNFVPSGWDNWLGVPITASSRAQNDGILGSIGGNNGTTWLQALYRGYTDASFTTRTPQQNTAGSQGPLIRAEVGDLIQIYFRNSLPENYASIHSMGLTYSKESEGSLYANTTDGSSPSYSVQEAVPPQGCAVYKWFVTNDSAPTGQEPSRLWSYHSFVNMYADTNAGLMGPLVVYAKGAMNATMETHREFTLLYNVYTQTESFLAAANDRRYGNGSLAVNDIQLAQPYSGNYSIWKPQLINMPTVSLSSTQAPKLHAMNGYLYSNGAPFEMCQDDQVIWYIYAFGSASHVFHMHGNNFKYQNEYYARLPGVWQVLCHVNNHLSGGMEHDYQIYPRDTCSLPKLRS